MLPILFASLLPFAAEPEAATPKGVAPEVVVGQAANGQLVITRTVYKTVVEKVKKQVTVGGVVQNVEVTQYRTVPVQVKQAIDLTGATVTDADGKKIPPANARKRLATESPLLISTTGEPIDKSYLKLFKSGVLVITLKPVSVMPVPGTTKY